MPTTKQDSPGYATAPASFGWVEKQKGVIRYNLYNMLGSFAVGGMIRKIKQSSPKSIKEVSDFIFSFSYSGLDIKPIQVTQEFEEFLELLKNHKINCFLEIGSAKGGAFFAFSHIASEDALMLSLDTENKRKWKKELIESFTATPSQKVLTFHGDSHSKETLHQISEALKSSGRKLDFLFIDGDHSFEGVKQDFEMYSGLVKEGGIIGFHDIASPDMGVETYYRELVAKRKHKEIIAHKSQLGIGILYV